MRTVSKKARRRKLKGSHESYETGPDAKEGRDSHCGARPELGSLIFRLSFVALNEAVMVRGLLRTSNLPQLQNLIKRDPVSYEEDFLPNGITTTLHVESFRSTRTNKPLIFGSWSLLSRRQESPFVYAVCVPSPSNRFNRSRSSIPRRHQSFLPTCPPCSWRASAPFRQIFATASYRIW